MPFIFKTYWYSFCACVQNILKIVTFVIEKKLAFFSLFFMLSPLRPKMPFGQLNVSIQIYNICKGRLGSKGERGAISESRHQTSDKNRPLCKMVVFIVHQLYKYIYSIVKGRLFYPSLIKVYFTYVLLNNKYS